MEVGRFCTLPPAFVRFLPFLNLPALSARPGPISLVISLYRNSSGLRVLPEGFLCWLSVLHAWLQGQSLL